MTPLEAPLRCLAVRAVVDEAASTFGSNFSACSSHSSHGQSPYDLDSSSSMRPTNRANSDSFAVSGRRLVGFPTLMRSNIM